MRPPRPFEMPISHATRHFSLRRRMAWGSCSLEITVRLRSIVFNVVYPYMHIMGLIGAKRDVTCCHPSPRKIKAYGLIQDYQGIGVSPGGLATANGIIFPTVEGRFWEGDWCRRLK